MNIPKNFVPEGDLDYLIEEALKEDKGYKGLIFAASSFEPGAYRSSEEGSSIYVYDASMEEPLEVGFRGMCVRSLCYDHIKSIVYDAGDYRAVFYTFEGKPITLEDDAPLTKSPILSIVYHQGEVYYAAYNEGVFRLSDKKLIAERRELKVTKKPSIIQALFIYDDKLCDATRMGNMRFTKTGEIITSPLDSKKKLATVSGIRNVAVYKDIIYDCGDYGIRNAFEDKIVKKREGLTLSLLPFGDKLLDAGLYDSIQDVFTNKCFLPFGEHITAMATIPTNMVEKFREKHESS